MGYVYRFINTDEKVIYVGLTKNLENRMYEHFGTAGHLPKECYDSVKRIEYITAKTMNDTKIKELYYIGLFNPEYNTKDKTPVSFDISTEDVWISLQIPEIRNRIGRHRQSPKKTVSINLPKVALDSLDFLIKKKGLQRNVIISMAIEDMHIKYVERERKLAEMEAKYGQGHSV